MISRPRQNDFRGDVDGLRAIAILIVVAFHAGMTGFAGGFVGVDVFFVISGFLITRNLLREAESTARVALLGFWAKRIRRLVPAMTLMVVVVLVGASSVLSRLDWQDVARQGAAAALYVSNLLYAREAQNYFGSGIESSPFLHTWSLGVEEQFYLVWPFLFVGSAALARRRGAMVRRLLVGAFLVVGCASFALNVWLTARGSTWAFFGLPTRAWEFAVAGLLAALPIPPALRGFVARLGLAVVGLATVAIATVGLSALTPYPGAWALLPVLGTVLIISSGDDGGVRRTPVTACLSWGPMQWLGRVSYSWYLWHWPFIILAVAAARDDRVGVRVLAAIAALPVAAIAHHYVENPLRFSVLLVASRPSTYAAGAAATVLSLLVAVGLTGAASRGEGSPAERQFRAEAGATEDSCEAPESSDGTGEVCVTGDRNGDRVVMLVGDSKALQWTRTLAAAAARTNTKLLVRFLGACPINPISADSFRIKTIGSARRGFEMAAQCLEHRAETMRLIAENKPDGLIIAEGAHYEATSEEWIGSLTTLLADIEASGVRPALILDNPDLTAEAEQCLKSAAVPASCTPRYDEFLKRTRNIRAAELAFLASRPDVPYYDAQAAICSETACRVVTDTGLIIFVDRNHFANAFAFTQLDPLTRLVERVARRRS